MVALSTSQRWTAAMVRVAKTCEVGHLGRQGWGSHHQRSLQQARGPWMSSDGRHKSGERGERGAQKSWFAMTANLDAMHRRRAPRLGHEFTNR